MDEHYMTKRQLLPVVKPIPMPPSVLQRMVDRATAQAETEATKALGLDFSQYTNAELDTVETAARAERRRRWLTSFTWTPKS